MGGGGFIGSHLTEALLNQQNNVTIFDRQDAPYLGLLEHKGAKIVFGDFSDPTAVEKSLTGVHAVFHLISTTVPKSSIDDPIFDIETNLIWTINFLNSAKNIGVKKVIFASSGGTVYGIPREIPISEDHPTEPISSYGIVKLAIEKYLRLFWKVYGLDYCILRVSNAYGERQVVTGAQGVVPTLIDKVLRNQKITIWGDGSVIRDYIHISDIVSAFLKANEHNGEPRIFNIGSGVGNSVNDIVHTLERFMAEPLDIIFEPARPYDVPINILDNSRAKRILNWEPKISITEGMRRTLEYMRESAMPDSQ